MVGQALDARLQIRLDHDHQVEQVLHLALDQQGHVVDGDLAGGYGVDACPGLGGDERQEDLLQARPAQLVGEDDPSQGRAVQGPLGGEDILAELGDDGGQARGAGRARRGGWWSVLSGSYHYDARLEGGCGAAPLLAQRESRDGRALIGLQ